MKLKNILGLLILGTALFTACDPTDGDNDVIPTAPIVTPSDTTTQQTPIVPTDTVPTDPTVQPSVPVEPTVPEQTEPDPTVQPSVPVEPTPTIIVVDTMEVIANIAEVPGEGGTIEFVTRTNVLYSVSTSADWITITSDGRALTADYTVTATVAANTGEAREGVITVTFQDEANTAIDVTVKQAAKPEEPSQEILMSVGGMSTITWVPKEIK